MKPKELVRRGKVEKEQKKDKEKEIRRFRHIDTNVKKEDEEMDRAQAERGLSLKKCHRGKNRGEEDKGKHFIALWGMVAQL